MDQGQPVEAKCVIIGDAGVGKTCIVTRLVRNQFNNEQISTSGASFFRYVIESGKTHVKFQLWDTAGQDKFRSLTAMYYRGATAVVICYDVTRPTTLQDARLWHEEFGRTEQDASIILVGNKAESAQRQVTTEQGRAVATELGLLFAECSAKTGENVRHVFEQLANAVAGRPAGEGRPACVGKVSGKPRGRCC